MENKPAKIVIKEMRLGHCARGSKICKKCQETEKEKKYCLLELFKNSGVTRPITKLSDGWYEYDIIKTFQSKKEASEHAKKNGIEIVDVFHRLFRLSKQQVNSMNEAIAIIPYPVSQILIPDQKPTFCLLELGAKFADDGNRIAMPMISINGRLIEYSVIRTFKSLKEAEKYAKVNGIKIIKK